jgi:tRNA(Glu) U13 pseudouridine synthase TruD
MHKENINTLQAIGALPHQLKMKTSLFRYAGTKGKRGKTSQALVSSDFKKPVS